LDKPLRCSFKRSILDNLKALQAALSGIEGRLTAIESQLESDRSQIQSGPDAVERGQLKDGDRLPSSPGVALSRINQATERMVGAQSQSQILVAYLEEALSMASRGILFLKENEQYSKWQSIGFDAAQVEPIGTQDQSSPISRAASDRQVVISGEDLEETFPWLRELGETPRMSLCIPLVFGDTVPVVLYLDSTNEVPIDSLELLTHLVVLILKNQYLQQLAALESAQLGKAVAEEIVFSGPLQFTEKEETPAAEAIEHPGSVTRDGPAARTAKEPILRLAGTSGEEETTPLEGAQDDGQSEPDTLNQKETRADPENILTLPNDTVPQVQASDPEPAQPLTENSSPEAAQVVVGLNRREQREPDSQPAPTPAEPTSPKEASDSEPVPALPEFTYRKLPPKDEGISNPSEDTEGL
jgi:hypothetical protein